MGTRRDFIGSTLGAGVALATAGCATQPAGGRLIVDAQLHLWKASGPDTASQEPYPFRDLTPHLRRVFDAYGPRRCHWGTDLTAGFARATWRQRITHFTEELTFLSDSDSDRDWVLGRSLLERLKWA